MLNNMLKKSLIAAITILSVSLFAGGWDKGKGLDKITVKGELVCVGCSLKKLNGANAQCSLYSHHAIGFKAADGTMWTIVDNAKGHDIINAHKTVIHKTATITGYLYPIAHMIEIDNIKVDGVSSSKIAKAAWNEDQAIAKALLSRKVGKAPVMNNSHH